MNAILDKLQTLQRPLRATVARDGLLNLSSNTLLHPNIKSLQQQFINTLPTFSEYASYDELRSYLAQYYQTALWQVGFAAGSDYLISLLLQLTTSFACDKIYLQQPYYYNYVNYAHALNIPYELIPFENIFSDELLKQLQCAQPSFIFLTSPCPITGKIISYDLLDTWLEKITQCGHFVILDQAYAGFGSSIYVDLVKRHQAFFLFQTYSKCFGAAGIRFCHYFGPEILIRCLKEYGIENTLSTFAIQYALFVHNNMTQFASIQNDIINWRDEITAILADEINFTLQKSYANFVSFATDDIQLDEFIAKAYQRKIFLKKHFYNNHAFLRITVAPLTIFHPIYSIFSEMKYVAY